MKELIIIAFAAFLTENVILGRTWGICPFLGVSKKQKNAVGMGIAVTFVIVITTTVTWLLYNFVLKPLDMGYLQILVFILVISLYLAASPASITVLLSSVSLCISNA